MKQEFKDAVESEDIKDYCKELIYNIDSFEKSREQYGEGTGTDKDYEMYMKAFEARLSAREVVIESKINMIEREWESSLILRWKMQKRIKEINAKRTEEMEKLYSPQ